MSDDMDQRKVLLCPTFLSCPIKDYPVYFLLSSVCLSVVSLSVTYVLIVAKRCVLEQKLLLTACRKSHMRNRFLRKWWPCHLGLCIEVV